MTQVCQSQTRLGLSSPEWVPTTTLRREARDGSLRIGAPATLSHLVRPAEASALFRAGPSHARRFLISPGELKMHALILQAALLAWQPQLADDAAFIAEVRVFGQPPIALDKYLARCEAVAETLTDPKAIQEMRCRIAVSKLRLGIGSKAALAELKGLAPAYGDDPAYHLEVLDGEVKVGQESEIREEMVNRVIARFPNSVELLAYKAACRIEASDYPSAIQLFTEAISLDPKYSLSRRGRAGCYYYLNETERAIEDVRGCLDQPFEFHHDTGDAYRVLALGLVELGSMDQALKAAQHALTIGPGQIEFHRAVWICYANSNRHFNALRVAQNYLAANPNTSQVLMLEALSELSLGRQTKALRTARRIIAENQGVYPAHSLLARALMENNLHAEALEAFKEAETVDLGGVYFRESWDCRARQAFLLSSVNDVNPRNPHRCSEICRALRAEAIDPRNQRFIDLIQACSLANSGDFPAALALIDSTLSSKPNSAELQVIRELQQMFESKKPHLMTSDSRGVLRIPNVGYFYGRLKSLLPP